MSENTSDNQKNDVNDSNQSSNSIYEGKSDHEVVVLLEKQTLQQEQAIQDLQKNLNRKEQENSALMKMQGQISVVRLVFIGVMTLIGCMVVMSVVSWWSPKVTGGIEKELAFFERLLLVMLGILSSAVVALYDSRGGGSSSGGG
jgi:hypothetical protein